MQTEASELVVSMRDPWPSPQPAWQDPPWVLYGRVLTAWFEAPWSLLERAVSPDLLPERSSAVRTRLRFYDLRYDALGENPGQELAPRNGVFREAAIGFPTRAGDIEGETSIFMWADSDTYVMWAREAFGWPLLLAEIELDGDVWLVETIEPGHRGSGHVADSWGSATLKDGVVTGTSGSGSPAAPWLTPRRLLHCAGLAGETRELQIVRPQIRHPGARFSGTARVEFAFRAPHPLSVLTTSHAELDVVDGFELEVGSDVSLL